MLRLIGSMSFIWLVMAISTMAQPWSPVLDADGKPLRSGVRYYMLPATTGIAGGLTCNYTAGSRFYQVVQEPLATNVSQGIPVIFKPSVEDNVIWESRNFTIEFSGNKTCGDSESWKVKEDPKTKRRFIVTGSEYKPMSRNWYFKIVKNKQGLYTLVWCQDCSVNVLYGSCPSSRCLSLGVVAWNGKRLLVVDGVPAFPFVFKRA